MMPDHPRWKEFVDRMSGPEGVNFTQTDPDPKTATWTCHGDLRFARAILPTMDGVDLEASIAFFDYYCDCEILLNLVEDEGEEDSDAAATPAD